MVSVSAAATARLVCTVNIMTQRFVFETLKLRFEVQPETPFK
jgi:hypothetical protein